MAALFSTLEGTHSGFGPTIYSLLWEIFGDEREPQQTNSPNMQKVAA